MTTGFIHPEFIVETTWLAEHLQDDNVRVLDCTTHLMPPTAILSCQQWLLSTVLDCYLELLACRRIP